MESKAIKADIHTKTEEYKNIYFSLSIFIVLLTVFRVVLGKYIQSYGLMFVPYYVICFNVWAMVFSNVGICALIFSQKTNFFGKVICAYLIFYLLKMFFPSFELFFLRTELFMLKALYY